MTRDEFVQRLVLDKICDDYENVDQSILLAVIKDGVECGLRIDRAEVVDALAVLIAKGLAKVYVLSSREPFATEIDGMPMLDIIEANFHTYFLATH